MRRWQNITWVAAAILISAALTEIITAPAMGQVRPVTPARFDKLFAKGFQTGGSYITETISPPATAGKKLFLQSISMHCKLTEFQSISDTHIRIHPAGGYLWVALPFQTAEGATSDSVRHFVGNRDISMLLEPGETIEVVVNRTGKLGQSTTNQCVGSVYGYFVDANQ